MDLKNYKNTINLYNNNNKGKGEIKYFMYDYKEKGKQLIFTYSSKRARKDKYEREKKIEKAKKILENPESIKLQNTMLLYKEKMNMN